MNTESLSRITIEPGKSGGRPSIRGMRIRVSDILFLLAVGATHAQILSDFPDLVEDDIFAALGYAAIEVDQPAQAAA